jgi:hypothetical protein
MSVSGWALILASIDSTLTVAVLVVLLRHHRGTGGHDSS